MLTLKRAINRGFFQGPRMQVSTMGLVATGAGIWDPRVICHEIIRLWMGHGRRARRCASNSLWRGLDQVSFHGRLRFRAGWKIV